MLKKTEPRPNAVGQMVALLGTWHQRARSRHQLRELSRMDDHVLKDIGVCRSELLSEASKPFWR